MAELPRIKVCGLARAEDVDLAVEAGADACGFVHYPPSPRSVPAPHLRELAERVPPAVQRALVVVDPEPDELRELLEGASFDWVQLCGDESPDDWRGFEIPLLRRVPADASGPELARAWNGIARGFVIDHPASPGGSGLGVNLEWARVLSEGAPCLLAGGLHGDNVATRLEQSGAWGVDASSKLESSPGHKDPERTRAFVRAARIALDARATKRTPS